MIQQFQNLTISQMRELKVQYENINGIVQEYVRFNSNSYKRDQKINGGKQK